MTEYNPYISLLTWQEARKALNLVRPDFISLLDDYPFDDSFHFYKVRYPFGSHILQGDRFFLPNAKGEMQLLNEFPETIQQDLSYSAPFHPSGLNLSKNLEQFVILDERVIPFYVLTPGTFVGVAAALDRLNPQNQGFYSSFNMWEITAGARSTFLLSKISDRQSFKRLQKDFGLFMKLPESPYDHWFIFQELAQKMAQPWTAEILYFPRKFIDQFKEPAFAPLLNFLQMEHRKPFAFWRNQFSWQVTLSYIERVKRLKYSAHLLDTVKHLLALALGALPASAPAITEESLPLRFIQEAFLNSYQLESCPTIMQPTHFSEGQAAYYSLSYPTSVEYSSKSAQASSHINDLEELQMILQKLSRVLMSAELPVKHPLLEQLARRTQFSFFHPHHENHPGIQGIDQLLEEDPRFTHFDPPQPKELLLPKSSTFFKGCVRLSQAT